MKIIQKLEKNVEELETIINIGENVNSRKYENYDKLKALKNINYTKIFEMVENVKPQKYEKIGKCYHNAKI